MTPKKRRFKKDYAAELIKIAKGDLASAKALAMAQEGRPENALYFIQQACEKGLKAIYIANGLEVVMIHDLGLLVGGLGHIMDIPFQEELLSLTEYATIRRYEEGHLELDFETEVKPMLDIGYQIIDLADQSLTASHAR